MPNSVKYTVFIAFLEFIGCKKISQKGSHEKYKKQGLQRPIIVQKKDVVFPSVVASNLKTLNINYQEFLKIIAENKLK
jgi:predicted RNA binding protein YcfA (HicA-like mRNA interferase family)